MEYLKHSYAIGGCDLSATTDLTCATLLIRKPNDENVYVLQHYFIPQSKIDFLENTQSKEAPYKLWAEQGWLTINDGAQVDYTGSAKYEYTNNTGTLTVTLNSISITGVDLNDSTDIKFEYTVTRKKGTATGTKTDTFTKTIKELGLQKQQK